MIKKLNPVFTLLLVIFPFFFLFGCVSLKPEPIVPIEPVRNISTSNFIEQPTQQVINNGSIWKEDGALSELFVNPKAKRVGDIVTVKIVESSSASNQATTKTDRESSFSAGIENFFNLEKDFPSTDPFFNPFSSVKGNLESDFEGSGSTQRSGKLTAYITTRVTEVLPNGNLRIAGSREVTVNNDKQLIKLSGIIRPRDIAPNNEIFSTYISEAKIEYSGSGIIDNRQRPGWLASILNIIWPF